MPAVPHDPELLRLAADITAAQVSHNAISVEALPDLIGSIYTALNTAGFEAPAADKPRPAVPANKSVFPDYIICLEDGKKMRMLKRHLQASYGLTPDAYKKRWNLPATYPMIAPNYAATRSEIAKGIGLGRVTDKPEPPQPPAIQRIPEGCGAERSGKLYSGPLTRTFSAPINGRP